MDPRPPPPAPSPLLAPLLALAQDRGVTLDLAGLGLPPGAGEATPLTPPQLGRLLDALATALEEPHLGLTLPSALRLERYELPALAAHASPTLRAALQRLTRWSPLLADAAAFSFEEAGGQGRLLHQVAGYPRGAGRHLSEYALAGFLHECAARTGVPLPVREVGFIHPRPGGSLEALVAFFGTTALRFGQPHNSVGFDAAALDVPQRTADPRLLQTAEALAAEALRRRPRAAEGFRAVVAARVREALERPGFSLRAVAQGLRMSTRTLQRRLEAEGTRFAAVLDEVREQLARELVARPEPSLSEVAFQLGFAEFATFGRAFKRWTGQPPGAFRAAAAPGGPDAATR